MNKQDHIRLEKIERRIKEIAEEEGLLTTDTMFEVVPSQKMLEAMAYTFPTNFSHWSFGRDHDAVRTIYEATGGGIPYEVVWNFETPKALLVETNPFALNALIVAHVFGHIDFFLGSRFLQHGRSFTDIAEEARNAAERFRHYESKYSKEEVEKTIDAGMSIQWQQHPDPFFEEELDNDKACEYLIQREHQRLKKTHTFKKEFGKPQTEEDRQKIETRLRSIRKTIPPKPVHDLLGYIIRYSTVLYPWQKDVLTVVRNQARTLAPNARTKMLNEGWATYWHVRIMRRLFKEGLLTAAEHGVFNDFHSKVTRDARLDFNWYRVGLTLFECIKERWDKGQFGKAYDECEDPEKKAYWDTGVNKGTEKMFEIRKHYSDRMAVEEIFTDEFIKRMQLYIYEEETNEQTGEIKYIVVERRPYIIRQILKTRFSSPLGAQPIRIKNANYRDRGELFLTHRYTGTELEPKYRDGTMEHLFYLWGRKVYISSVIDGKPAVYSFNGKAHKAASN